MEKQRDQNISPSSTIDVKTVEELMDIWEISEFVECVLDTMQESDSS